MCGGVSKGHTRETEVPRDQQQQEVVTIIRRERKEAVFLGLKRVGLMEAGGFRGMIGVVKEHARNVAPEGTSALSLPNCLLHGPLG